MFSFAVSISLKMLVLLLAPEGGCFLVDDLKKNIDSWQEVGAYQLSGRKELMRVTYMSEAENIVRTLRSACDKLDEK